MRIHRALAVLLLTLAFSGNLYARHRSAPTMPVTEVEGVLKSVTATQLVVTDNHNLDVSINISKDTIFRSEDMAIAPADLMPGDRVEVKAVQAGSALNALVVNLEKEPQQKPQVLEINGAIKSVSPTEIVVTDAQQHDTTVEVTKDTMIRKGDRAATVADLVIGDRVEVKAVQAGTMLNALLVKAEAAEPQEPELLEINGVIKSVSPTEIVVTDMPQDVTIEITSNTMIRKNDQAATTADLAVGDRVEVKATVNGTTKTAVMINDETETEPEDDVEVSGTVSATGSNQITLTTSSGDVTVKVDANTRIRKDDLSIGIADIKTGDRVEAKGTRVDKNTILAREIEVRSNGGND